MEVDTISQFNDADGSLVGIVFQDHLFQEEEGSLVVDALADLDTGQPGMGSPLGLALVTLQIRDDELDNKCLLEQSIIRDFFLHC